MTDKKFTDEEIIKALECCSTPCCECDECPLYCVGANCSSFELHRYVLNLVNRQKAQIDELCISLEAMRNAATSYKAECKRLDKESADKEKAVADATEQAKKEIEEYKQQLAALDAANKDAIDRAADLEKRLAVSSSPETVKFTFYFDSLQSDYAKLIESISKIKADNPEVAEKYAAALRKYHDMISAQISAN